MHGRAVLLQLMCHSQRKNYIREIKEQGREKGYEAHLFLALLNGTGTQDGASVERPGLWAGMFVSLSLQVNGKHEACGKEGSVSARVKSLVLLTEISPSLEKGAQERNE